MSDGDIVPAKRLRYSPESKHATKPKVSYLDQKENKDHDGHILQPGTVLTSPSRSSGSAVTHAGSDSASDHATTSQTQATTKGLRASATPWTPTVNNIWSSVSRQEPSWGWQSGSFDMSVFGAAKATTATCYGATGQDAAASKSHCAQVQSLWLELIILVVSCTNKG